MAYSGTYKPTVTFNGLAEEALDLMQLGQDGETLDGDMVERCRKTANLMLKAWAGQGIHLWTQEEGALFLVVGQAKYDFATSNLANTWSETTLSAAEGTGQTVLSCTSTKDIAALDVIGVVLDTKDIHWTTVVSKTSAEVTISDALPSDSAAGNFVRSYVSSSFIPVTRITDVRRRESTTYEIPINFESRKDYFGLPNRATTGTPIQAYFSRQEPPGTMYIWPAPSTAVDAITFSYERPIQVIDDADNNLDIPDYWQEAFVYNLAKRAFLKFGGSPTRFQIIAAQAQESLDVALNFDSETYPVTMVMRHE